MCWMWASLGAVFLQEKMREIWGVENRLVDILLQPASARVFALHFHDICWCHISAMVICRFVKHTTAFFSKTSYCKRYGSWILEINPTRNMVDDDGEWPKRLFGMIIWLIAGDAEFQKILKKSRFWMVEEKTVKSLLVSTCVMWISVGGKTHMSYVVGPWRHWSQWTSLVPWRPSTAGSSTFSKVPGLRVFYMGGFLNMGVPKMDGW